MKKTTTSLTKLQPGDSHFGFRLLKKQYVLSKSADLYTLQHEKTGAQLLYFDRPDENKTFAIAFTTLPEDSTGVFHILEHSVLNGSRKYPVKEPFVSLLQSSLQTYLNALTFSDKTLYPVSSRNEQDLFNLMAVYLDAVFCPSIYDRPEIFRQEGWHYEFDGASDTPFYNGVVFSEMKGVFADVDRIIEEEADRMLFPDTCYGHVSGGHPEHIPELTYEQFLNTHRRFYHPSNARIFLDGHLDIDRALAYIDGEYLSHYTYRAPDFAFTEQVPKTAEKTVCYEVREGEEALAHMAVSKIFCRYDDTEKIYAARVLADYLTGSNEAPLKRAFLEKGLAQDIILQIHDGVYQPTLVLIIRNTDKTRFSEIRTFLPQAVQAILKNGLNREALLASLERFAFVNREISEPYGVELAIKALDGWLYGEDPLTHIDNESIFETLRNRTNTAYFADLLAELLADAADKSYLYVLPSDTKGQEDAEREAARLSAITATWDDAQRQQALADFDAMQRWQQSADDEETLATLPHLDLRDIPPEITPTPTTLLTVTDTQVLKVETDTNGIVYLNLYFDVSDLSVEELRRLSVLAACLGELRTAYHAADVLQTKIKATMGSLSAHLEPMAPLGNLTQGKPYLTVSVSALRDNVPAALALLQEILLDSPYDETARIEETVRQSEYFLKQSLIGNGHVLAITKALSAFSRAGALKELLEGESFVRWFSTLTNDWATKGEPLCRQLRNLAAAVFSRKRLFAGFSGPLETAVLSNLIEALPATEIGPEAAYPAFNRETCAIEIPGDVGFSALGHNLYALGGRFSGSCSVLASLMSFSYLWNAVRVRGGAYGTGMGVRANGDIFCYSYRDPNLKGTRSAFDGLSDFLKDFLGQNPPLDDIIIGAVGSTDPLLEPAGVCDLACVRYLKGITPSMLAQTRRELLNTTPENLAELIGILHTYTETGKFCAIGSKAAIAFATQCT